MCPNPYDKWHDIMTCGWHAFCYYSDRLTHTGTQGPIFLHTFKYILTAPVTCAQQLPVLHWINNFLIQKFTLQRSTIFLLSKNYSLVEVIHLLIGLKKTTPFLWNTKNTERNGANGENIHTTQKEEDNFRKS